MEEDFYTLDQAPDEQPEQPQPAQQPMPQARETNVSIDDRGRAISPQPQQMPKLWDGRVLYGPRGAYQVPPRPQLSPEQEMEQWAMSLPMTKQDQARLQQQVRAVRAVMTDPNLSQQEKMDLTTQLRSGIDIGKRRMDQQSAQAKAAQMKQMEELNALKTKQMIEQQKLASSMRLADGTLNASQLEKMTKTLPDGSMVFVGPDAKPVPLMKSPKEARAENLSREYDAAVKALTKKDPTTGEVTEADPAEVEKYVDRKMSFIDKKRGTHTPDTFAYEPADVQEAFKAKYGDQAAEKWAEEHTQKLARNKSLQSGQGQQMAGGSMQVPPSTTEPEQAPATPPRPFKLDSDRSTWHPQQKVTVGVLDAMGKAIGQGEFADREKATLQNYVESAKIALSRFGSVDAMDPQTADAYKSILQKVAESLKKAKPKPQPPNIVEGSYGVGVN